MHNDKREEVTLCLSTDNPHVQSVEIPYNDIEDLIQAQTLTLAITQASRHPELKKLNTLVQNFKDELQTLVEDLHHDLSKVEHLIPKQLKSLDWHTASTDELTDALLKAHQIDAIETIQQDYSEKISDQLTAFVDQYTTFIDSLALSLTYEDPSDGEKPFAGLIPSEEDIPPEGWWQGSEQNTRYALKWCAAGAAGAVFVTWVLPKILKKPFSNIAAESGLGLFMATTRSRIFQFTNWFFPNAMKSESRAAKIIQRFGKTGQKFEKLTAQGELFKRAFWQNSGNTTAFALWEMILRPLVRSPGERGYENAIFSDKPFSDSHTIWVQKNFLHRVFLSWIIGSLSSSVGLTILERDFEKILQSHILDRGVETAVSRQIRRQQPHAPFEFTKDQKHWFARMIRDDTKILKATVAQNASLLIDEGIGHPDFAQLKTEEMIKRARERWITEIEKMVHIKKDFRFEKSFRERLARFLEQRTTRDLKIKLREATYDIENAGRIKKFLMAFGNVLHRKTKALFNNRVASSLRFMLSESWGLWSGMNKSYFWTDMLSQCVNRGSVNPSIFAFRRTSSLLFSTPLYVTSYLFVKRRFQLRTHAAEFAFGFASGFVTNAVSSWLFLHVYEKHIWKTAFDLDSDKILKTEEEYPTSR